MKQLITAQYQSLHWHELTGDMHEVVQKLVRRGNAVPIDVNVVSAPTHPFPIPGNAEEVFSKERIDALIEHLNHQYEEPTKGKLRFQLRGIAYYHVDRFPDDIPLDAIAT